MKENGQKTPEDKTQGNSNFTSGQQTKKPFQSTAAETANSTQNTINLTNQRTAQTTSPKSKDDIKINKINPEDQMDLPSPKTLDTGAKVTQNTTRE